MSVEDRVRGALNHRIKPISRGADEHVLLGFTILLFGTVVFVDSAVLDLGLFRPVIVVPFLTVIPGYLLLRIIQVEPRDFTTGFLYVIGMSLVFLMLFGFVINSFYPLFGIEEVFTEWTLFVSLFVGLGGLFAIHSVRNDSREVAVGEHLADLWQPWPLGLLCVPFLAILGARMVTRFGENALILSVLTLMGLLAVAAYVGVLPKQVFPLAIWAIAISLLLHNSVLTHVQAWDAPIERRLAETVLANGVWDPSVGGKWMKNAMLRIVILHPIYSLLSGIDLLWEYKTVGPLLFSFAPLAFYKAYQVVVDKRDAFIAAVLAMSLFSFFTVLSWNSRTSGALLFLGLVALTVTDRTIARRKHRILLGCFLFGIIVSHYATAYMVLIALSLVLVGNWVILGHEWAKSFARTTAIPLFFFGTVVLAWYIFVVHKAGAFSTLVGTTYGMLSEVWLELYGPGDEEVVSATASYVTTHYTSNTIRWLQPINILLGILAGVGIAIQLLPRLVRSVRDRWRVDAPVDTDEIARTEYILYSTGFLGVFGITFLPLAKLNTARTLMPAFLYFAPFVVLLVRLLPLRLGTRVGVPSVRRVGKVVALALVLTYFALNVGLYGSVAEQEYHPNILIDKGRVVESGNLAEKKYFWAIYVASVYDIHADDWSGTYEDAEGEYRSLQGKQLLSGMYACEGVRRQPVIQQGTCADGPAFHTDDLNKIYSTAGSEIFLSRGVTS